MSEPILFMIAFIFYALATILYFAYQFSGKEKFAKAGYSIAFSGLLFHSAALALYLHTRIVMGWKGRRSAIIAIVGFLAALFIYFGVNYLLAGLHIYV